MNVGIKLMKKLLVVLLFGLFKNAYGYDGITSEMSHAAGGAVIAGAVVKMVDDSPNRAWVGFGVSTSVGILAQAYEMSAQNAKFAPSLLDAGAHALGAALGAWVTDKYILLPVINRSYSGVMLYKSF